MSRLFCYGVYLCLSLFIVLPLAQAQDVTVTYEYDDLGRLKKAMDSAGQVVEYEYDPAGNREEQTITIGGDFPVGDNIPTIGTGPNLLDLSTWPTGTVPSGPAQVPGWSYGSAYYNETRWTRLLGPGQSGLITSMEVGQTDPDPNGGGVNPTPSFTIDETRAYEYSIYFKKYDTSVQSVYLGTTANWSVPQLRYVANNAEVSNPYFISWTPAVQAANLDEDKWYKVVGYVMPEGWPHESTSARGGVYEVESGQRVASVSNFRWHEDRTTDSHHARFFTYYDEATQNRFTTHFYKPEVRVTTLPPFSPVVPQISLSHSSANEGSNIVFTATLSQPTTVETRVNFVVDHSGATGSAQANDYTASSGTLTFAPGATQATVSVPTTNDSTPEPNELVRITLDSEVRAVIATASREAVIYDDDSSASFSIAPTAATEGSSLSFTVTKSGTTFLTHAVNYATANGSASSSSDYTAASGTLSFGPSETSKTITVATTNDSVDEPNETLSVSLNGATNGATIATASATGTINDNDAPPSFSVNDVSVSEGGTLVFTVSKGGLSTTQTYSVNYATATSSASSGDFSARSGTLSFGPSETSKTVSVPTTEDAVHENNEVMLLNLSGASGGATIPDTQGIGTINNDDVGPVFSVAPSSVTEGGTLSFVVTKGGSTTAKSHNVNYATFNGTAVAPSDYTAKSGTLTFAPSETQKTVTVNTVQESVYESTEAMQLRLSSATNGATTHSTLWFANGSITNDDPPPNNPPTAVNDGVNVALYSQSCLFPLTNDSDPDNHTLTITSITQPFNASASLTGASQVCVVGMQAGSATMSYTISDGNGGTDTATITVNVTGGGGGIPQ